jgi:hypothetical protein
MSVFDLLNVSARSETVSETVKKSKASHDQARKATRKNSHCWVFSMASNVNGFGAFAIGGLRVLTRVAAYLAGDIWRLESSTSSSP